MIRRIALVIALAPIAGGCTHRPVQVAPATSPRAVADTPFVKSLSFSLLEDYEAGEDLAGIENDFTLMHELGISSWRGSLGWDDLEPRRGEYDFAWLHAFAELAGRERITLRPYIGYTPEWAAVGRRGDEVHWNDPPADPGSWVAFIGALATQMRQHANVASYEIYNEPNSRIWWDGTPAEYFEVLAGASTAIRAAHPGAQVVMGGLAWPDAEWLDRMCEELGGAPAFDAIAFHGYPETWAADSVTVETYLGADYHQEFVPRADSLCGGKPVWLNELGSATAGERTEWEHANWWARAIATYAADRRIGHLGIFQLRDRPAPNPGMAADPNHHLGLVHADGRRKLAFSAVQMLVALLNTDSLVVADAEPDIRLRARRERELYRHLFVRPDGRQVLILWDKQGSPLVDIRLPRGGSRATSYDLDGTVSPLRMSNGVVRRVRLQKGWVRIIVVDP